METRRNVGSNGAAELGTRPTHAPYPPEFRAQAVQLMRTEGTSMRQVAKDLGVHEETLRLWVRQDDVDARRCGGLATAERAERTQPRRRVRVRVREEEREILKNVRAHRHFLVDAETPIG